MKAHRRLVPQHGQQRWRTFRIASVGLVLAGLAACSDETPETISPADARPQQTIPPGATGFDLNDFGVSPLDVDGAIWEFPAPANVGTGNIDPFLSIQNNPDEEGFNTDASSLPLDTKRPQFTDALPLNNIPLIQVDGGLFREIIFDANESNSFPDAQFSIDRFDLWICLDEAPFEINTADEVSDFASNASCELIYAPFSPGNEGFATDAATQGSGQALDYRILIPNDLFDTFMVGDVSIDDCPYNPLMAPCGLWVILHAEMGHFGGDWVTNATFDEFSTVRQPFVTITKTAVPEFTREYLWEIDKVVDPEIITLFDGQSQNADYDVVVTQTGSEDSGWQVSGVITIANPSDEDATISSFSDFLTPGDIDVTGDVICPGGDPVGQVIDGGDELVCTYTHTFGSDPGEGPFVNHVELELEGLAVSMGESDPFSFTTPTSEVNKMVDVEDNMQGTLATDILTGDTYEYTIQYTCDADEGSHNNIASVVGDNDVVLDTDDATVVVNCLDVTVTKEVDTQLQRTYFWQIDKTVTPATWALFNGESGTSEYTVTLTPDGSSDAAWMVSGDIHVTNVANTNSLSVWLQDVADVISPDIASSVDCGVSFPYELASGATLDCTYGSTAVPDGSDRTNTATATAWPTQTGSAYEKEFSGNADVSFGDAELIDVDKIVDVTDTYPDGGVIIDDWDHDNGQKTVTYERTFTCDADAGTHDNTATIVETGQSDDASVTVTCYQLSIEKDADESFNRYWAWDIDKGIVGSLLDGEEPCEGDSEECTEVMVQENQALIVTYLATLTAESTDDDHAVEGDITVSNPHPTRDADLTALTDIITGGIDASASIACSGDASLVPADGSLSCTYGPTDLPDDADRTNTATATQQLYDFDKDGLATPSGTTDHVANADIVFGEGDLVDEIDECVDVGDVMILVGPNNIVAGPDDLGTYCAGDSPVEIQYERQFGGVDGIPLVCNETHLFENTADFITNDTGATGSDDEQVSVLRGCEAGCTLTPGYWKTHNQTFASERNGHGPPPDATWFEVDFDGDTFFEGENEEFFGTGMTYYEVLWTPKRGNVYYNLSFHYIAAKLNMQAGASAPQEVLDAIEYAETYFFATYTPETAAALKGNNEDRQDAIAAAGVLGEYNEGLIGPGHCTEDQTSEPG